MGSRSRLVHLIRRALAGNVLAGVLNLVLSSGVTAVFGFLFWIIVARFYDSNVVGLATTLLSTSSLVALLGQTGFDILFMRFLPKSKHPNEQINGGLLVTAGVSMSLSLLFCALVPMIIPKLSFVGHNLYYVAAFTVFTVLTAWNALTNAILVAYRKTPLVLIINFIFSFAKVVAVLIAHNGGAMMIFTIAGIAQAINVALSLAMLAKYCGYTPAWRVDLGIFREIVRFGAGAYVSNILNLLPPTVLPLIIVSQLGAKEVAYFYIAFSIANLLYTIAFSTNQVLLVEASHEKEGLEFYVKKGIKLGGGFMLPAIFALVILSPIALGLFGSEYTDNTTNLLRILSIGGGVSDVWIIA